MKTALLMAIGLAALWGSGAQAAQITFGPSSQSITFTGDGAGSVAVSSPTLTGSAFDTTNAFVGSFTLSALSFTAGPQSGGIFSAGANTETFTYANPDGDTLTETWHISFIQDNTPQPKFFGTGITTAISGDAAFLAAFGPVGTIDSFDWIEMPLTCGVPTGKLRDLGPVGHYHDLRKRTDIERREAHDHTRARISRSHRQCVIRAGLAWPTSGQGRVKRIPTFLFDS